MALVLGRSAAVELEASWCDRERRGSPRISSQGSVRVFEARAGLYFAAELLDVSETGMRLRMPAFGTAGLVEGTRVHIVMLAQGSQGRLGAAGRRNMTEAQIVWKLSSSNAAVARGIEVELGLHISTRHRAAVGAA